MAPQWRKDAPMLIKDAIDELFAEAIQADSTGLFFPSLKLCGISSRNGRSYPDAVLAEAVAAGLYEEVPLCIPQPGAHRDQALGSYTPEYAQRVGLFTNTKHLPGKGVFGDATLNPKHTLAESVAWDIGRRPKNMGFSQMADCAIDATGKIITKIGRVHSVELVLNPATTKTFAEEEQLLDPVASIVENVLAHPDFATALAKHAAETSEMCLGLVRAALTDTNPETKAESLRGIVLGLISERIKTQGPSAAPQALRPGAAALPAAPDMGDWLAQLRRRQLTVSR